MQSQYFTYDRVNERQSFVSVQLSECICRCVSAASHSVRVALGRPGESEVGGGNLRGIAEREKVRKKRLRLIPQCGSGA